MVQQSTWFRHRRRLGQRAILVVAVVVGTWLWAHEGHHPLPSRGAQLDPANPDRLVVTAAARQALDVQTEVVRQQCLAEPVLANARVIVPWQQHAQIAARLAGRIHRILVQPGQTVSAGQVLAELISPEVQTLGQELLASRTELELTTRLRGEIEKLVRGGAASPQRLLELDTRLRQQEAALEIGRARWLSLGLPAEQLEQLLEKGDPATVVTVPLRSPIAGVVLHADPDLAANALVAPEKHIFEIADLSRLWVRIGVLEKDLAHVRPGQPVRLTLAGSGQEVHATIKTIDRSLDSRTHLGSAWLELPASAHPMPLLPGMYGQAQIDVSDNQPARTIPAEAVLSDGVQTFVLVEESATGQSSNYLRRPVVLGRRLPELVELRGGAVYPGDRVVTRGGAQLAGFFQAGVLKPGPEGLQQLGVRVAPVTRVMVEDIVEVEGTVYLPPEQRGRVAAPLAGTLEKILVEPGQVVAAGQVLGELASPEFQEFQLQLLRIHLEMLWHEETVQRLRKVADSVPARLLWEAEANLRSSAQQRSALRLKLLALGLTETQIEKLLITRQPIATLTLRAPRSGALVQVERIPGQAVRAQERLFEVHDFSAVLIQGQVAERDLARTPPGASVRIRLPAFPGTVLEGKVIRGSSDLQGDHRSRAIWVEVRPTPDLPLRHGLLARLVVRTGHGATTLAVPLVAVAASGHQTFVFVQGKDGVFERRAVITGRQDDRWIEICRGLSFGERIAMSGAVQLLTAHAGVR